MARRASSSYRKTLHLTSHIEGVRDSLDRLIFTPGMESKKAVFRKRLDITEKEIEKKLEQIG